MGSSSLVKTNPLRGLLPALLIPVAACAPDRGDVARVVRTDSTGVEVVHSNGPDRSLPWKLVEEARIGGRDDGPSAFARLAPGLIKADANARLFILDPQRRQVFVFDPDGSFVRAIGSAGGGPGELSRPFNLAVSPDGRVSVYDFAKPGLVHYDSDGVFLREQRLSIRYRGPDLTVENGAVLFTQRRVTDDEVVTSLAELYEGETHEFVSLARPRTTPIELPECGVRLPIGPVFAPSLHWSASGRSVIISAHTEYRVDLWSESTLVRSMRRPLPALEVTREMALREVGEVFTVGASNGRCSVPGHELLAARGYARELPAVSQVRLAPDGHTWVQRGHVRGDGAVIDVFDPTGAYLGSLPPGSPFPATFLDDRRIAALERDGLDVPTIAVYRIERVARRAS